MRIDVAVGILFNEKGEVLVGKRHLHQHQGGFWEFPGGKIEEGETVAEALERELLEEIGITVLKHEPWLVIEYDYDKQSVRLNVHKITEYDGEPKGCEGQEIQWRPARDLPLLEWVPANQSIVKALAEL